MKQITKHLLLSAIMLVAISITGIYIHNSVKNVSSIALSNIEALTADEVGMSYTCYSSIHEKDGCQVRYCATCKYLPGTDRWYSIASSCTYRE